MKKALYIGIYSEGSTSRMRADTLKSLLPGWHFEVIDTDVPFNRFGRVFRSIGFRFKRGPVIGAVNDYVLQHLSEDHYDLVWVDKAIFISGETTATIKKLAGRLVHFTPDTAFITNRSRPFYQSIGFYDYVITTKSFEFNHYLAKVKRQQVIMSHQGYDHTIHKPHYDFGEKAPQVAFVGLWEPSREEIIRHLIANGISVVLAGKKWDRFVSRYKTNKYLEFAGPELKDHGYAKRISSCYFALGLLSKRFPELHTTRTFEIPACGTALLTERNDEIASYYTDDEVIYFTGLEDLVQKIKYYMARPQELKRITENGHRKVVASGKSYQSIVKSCLHRVLQ